MRMLLVVLFGGIFFPVLAQVSISTLPFDMALKKAKEEGKILMLVLDTKSCARCNEITTMSLLEPAAKALNDSCVVIRPAIHSSDYTNLQKRFAKDSLGTGGIIFFSSSGVVLATNHMVSNSAEGYLLLVKRPLKVNQLVGQLKQLESAVQADTNNLQLLEQLLDLRYRLAWQADSLANVYFNKLPQDSLASDRVLAILLRSAPVLQTGLDTTTRKAIYKNGNRVYKSIPQPELYNIYKQMISKSRSKAIRDKDLKYAANIATFAKYVSGGTPKGDSYFYREMLNYCTAVKDTPNYFGMAKILVNKYLLTIDADSLKKYESGRTISQKKDSAWSEQSYFFGPLIDGAAIVGTNKMTEKTASELNTISWRVYELYKNPSTLKTALQWSKKSLDFHVLPAYYDTYARLLYVTGEPEKAIEVMTMAVQLGIRQLADVTNFQLALEAMKKGLTLRDPS